MFTEKRRRLRTAGRFVIEPLEVRCLPSGINLLFDFTYDVNNFFDTQAKRDLLDQAASVYEGGLTGSAINPYGINDSLAAIQPSGANTWSAVFTNPGTGANQSVDNLSIADGTILVFAGAHELPSSSTLAEAGPGGYNANGSQTWLDNVKARGQSGALSVPATDFSPWGGQMTFNSTANWFFGSTTAGLAGTGKTDFLTVATHELGHMFGFGTSDVFTSKVSGNNFTGANAVAAYDFGGNVPLSPDKGHWAQTVTDAGMEAILTPAVSANTRKTATDLDFAGIKDLGWTYSTGNQRMFRAYNPTADYHFFTLSFPEFANAVANGYHDESSGQPGWGIPDSRRSGSVPIHRLYNPNNGRHYYTYGDGERDQLVSLGWRYEKDEGNIYTTQVAGSTEIFRLYNYNSGAHLYTESAAQKDAILAQFPGIWVKHNSLGYGFLASSSGQVTQNAVSQPAIAGDAPPATVATSAGSTAAAVSAGQSTEGSLAAMPGTGVLTTINVQQSGGGPVARPAFPVEAASSISESVARGGLTAADRLNGSNDDSEPVQSVDAVFSTWADWDAL